MVVAVQSSGSTELLERGAEIEVFRAALQRATAGDGNSLAWIGPAGVGKSAVMRNALAFARTTDVTVLHVRAAELERDLAFGVARQLLSPALIAATPDEREAAFAGAAALARPVLGLAELAPPADPAAATLHGLHWLCANLALRRPLVLAVDDLHWADEATLRFLGYLSRQLDGLPILLLAAARPSEPGAERLLLEQFIGDEGVHTQQLRPLSADACATLVRQRLGADSTDRLCAACHQASGGNPFLLGELLLALVEDEIDPALAGETAVRDIGPESVARQVMGRLRKLDASANALARSLALFETGAGFREVAQLAELSDARAAIAADHLVEAAVLAPGRPLTFLHPVLRTAVYRSLADGERGQLHQRAAQLLRALGAPPSERAAHLLVAEPAGDPEALGELMAAAGEALVVGAPEGALRYLDRAVLEIPGPEFAAAPLHLRGLTKMLLADATMVDDLRAAAAAAQPGPARAHILRDLAGANALTQQQTLAMSVLDEAIATVGDEDPELAERLAVESRWISWCYPDLAERHIAMVSGDAREQPGTVEGRKMLCFQGWLALMRCEPAEETIELFTEAFESGTLTSTGFDGMTVVALASMGLAYAGRPDDALAHLSANLDASRAQGGLFGITGAHLFASAAHLIAGNLDEAQADADLSVALCDQLPGGDLSRIAPLAISAIVELERGDAASAMLMLDGLSPPTSWVGMWLLAARGRVLLGAARIDEAVEVMSELDRMARACGILHPSVPFDRGESYVRALLAAGRSAEARDLAEEHLTHARRAGYPEALGSALRARAATTPNTAIELLEESVAALEGTAFRLGHAKSLCDLGAALLVAGRRADARAPLRLALDTATRLGAGAVADAARAHLVASGARPRRIAVQGAEALTPAERRVASLAADGLSNREIAEQLFVTVRTVEMHISAALGKLGVRSRHELARGLAR